MPRIAIARFAHEGNSFAQVLAGIEDFRAFEWAAGDGVEQVYRGTNTEIGGVLDFLDRHPEWEPTFLRCTYATPSGEVRREAYDLILAEILDGLRGQAWDAVFLAQHGAMQVVGIGHADHEILRAVREVIGPEVPLAVSYDLHANITPAQLALADVVVGYKCHPHVDMAATAAKALGLLLDRIAGRIRPVAAWRPLPHFIPSINARTTDGPMAEAAAFARGLETGGGLLDATIYQGYAYGDRAHAGGCVVVWADGDQAAADAAAEALRDEVMRIYPRLFIHMPGADEGIAQALALLAEGTGPVAVIDPADHPGAGANADTPGLLRALIEARPAVPAVFAFLWDPETVARATEAGEGAELEVALGGRLSTDFGPPVRLRARVARLTDGRVVQTGPFQNGLAYDYGRTAVLEAGGVRIIVTEVCLMVSDPTFFELHGVELTGNLLLAVKAKNQFRAAFTDTFRRMIDVDVPGPAAYDFTRLPFRNVPAAQLRFPRPAPPG